MLSGVGGFLNKRTSLLFTFRIDRSALSRKHLAKGGRGTVVHRTHTRVSR